MGRYGEEGDARTETPLGNEAAREKAVATVHRMKKLEWFTSNDKGDAIIFIPNTPF